MKEVRFQFLVVVVGVPPIHSHDSDAGLYRVAFCP